MYVHIFLKYTSNDIFRVKKSFNFAQSVALYARVKKVGIQFFFFPFIFWIFLELRSYIRIRMCGESKEKQRGRKWYYTIQRIVKKRDEMKRMRNEKRNIFISVVFLKREHWTCCQREYFFFFIFLRLLRKRKIFVFSILIAPCYYSFQCNFRAYVITNVILHFFKLSTTRLLLCTITGKINSFFQLDFTVFECKKCYKLMTIANNLGPLFVHARSILPPKVEDKSSYLSNTRRP